MSVGGGGCIVCAASSRSTYLCEPRVKVRLLRRLLRIGVVLAPMPRRPERHSERPLKKGSHSEVWRKGVCDIWEKWVVEE